MKGMFLPLLSILTITCTTFELGAQRAPRFTLDRDFSRDFVAIVGVRELADGSVIVGDRLGREVVVLAPSQPDGRVLATNGSGPGEVRTVSGVMALPADTTLIYDSVLQRVVVTIGQRVRHTIPVSNFPWREHFLFPFASNARGDVYGLRSKASAIRRGPINPDRLSTQSADTAELVVLSAQGRKPSVLLRLRGAFAPSVMKVKTVAGVRSYHQLMALLVQSDLTAVCPDGRVLHASPTDGFVRWWRDARVTEVSLGSLTRIPVTDALKRREIAKAVGEENSKHFKADEYPAWPRFMPVFERNGAWCLGTGNAVLEGTADERGVRRYWLVAPSGSGETVGGAPTNAKLVGVGASHAYFAVETEDGLMRLSRYRIAID